LALPPSLTTIGTISFFFMVLTIFFYFPLIVNSSFDASGTFAVEVDLWCFASYVADGSNPWSVLNERIYLMTILATNF